MKLKIGIDTGGTYTDAVLVESSGVVLRKAKALTTPHDLSLGIAQAMDGLGQLDARQIKLVALSTTLATNAIVEGHGGRVALILIGYDEEIVQQAGLTKRLPVDAMYFVAGGHDIKGVPTCPLDVEAVRQAIVQSRDRVDAFAVSGYFGVMNPEHELRAREIINQLTGALVVCGHELSRMLDSLKRVTTAVLNARLLPVVQRLLDSVSQTLAQREIHAPLMVVRGDGSLMSERLARQRPVETILSGPAASAIGAQFLSGPDAANAIVVDMGGTTTDIAVLDDGQLWTNPAGATVSGWQTSVQAADLRTIGIGGDSHIQLERGSFLRVGPRRAIPLCRLGADWPGIVRELEAALYAGVGESDTQPVDFLTIARAVDSLEMSESEQALVQALRHGPVPLSALRRALPHRQVSCERLEDMGILRRAGLTPTDLLWSESSGIGGNGAAAQIGAQVMARQLNLPVEELTCRVIEHVIDAVAKEIADKLVTTQTGHHLFPAPPAWEFVMEQVLGCKVAATFDCSFRALEPIVAIGAPVSSFMPRVADKLHTSCIIPPHSEVGNAVGAVVASVSHTVEILVQPYVQGAGTVTYLVHTPQGREQFTSFAQAALRAEAVAVELARKAAYRDRAQDVSVKVERKQVALGALFEMTVRACATGRPRLAE